MPIQNEIWAADIAEKLFPDDSFVMQSIDDSPFSDGKTVHRGNSGAPPNVQKNRTVIPATASQRTDDDTTYDLDEFTTDPVIIRDIEEVEVNYNKRQSVLRGSISQLNLIMANWLLYYWSPDAAANMVRSSGDAMQAVLNGQVGNRKKVTFEDFLKLKTLFDDMDVPENGRKIMIPAYMHNQFIADNKTQLLSLTTGGDVVFTDSNLKKIFGFDVYTRGKKNVIRYSNAATPARLLPSDATAGTTNAAAIAWHPDFVTRAKGEVKIYDDIDNPLVYGSVISTSARAGGRKIYLDGTGVGAIVESAG